MPGPPSADYASHYTDGLVARAHSPPGPPELFPVSDNSYTFATAHLIATLILQIVAFLVLSARVYTRAFPVWRFTSDDYVICFAFALMSVAFGLWYKCDFWAWGFNHPPFRHLDEIIYNSMMGSIALPFWAWSTGLVKISIGLMLLRFQQYQRWKIVMYIMIALNVLLILLVGVVNLFQCIPYASLWDFRNEIKHKKCWKMEMSLVMLYSSSICNVVTDVVFSLMPLTFLSKIRRPMSEKLVVWGLMALGLVASAFSLSKAIINCRISLMSDQSASTVLLGLLSCMEVQTSLIAACAPTLRNSGKRVLQRMGLLHSTRDDSPPPYAADSDSQLHASKCPRNGRVELDRVLCGGANSPWRDWDGDDLGDAGLEEARYEQDPVTGRIICTTALKVHSSHSDLSGDWKADSHQGCAMEDECRGRDGIGMAQ